MNLIRRCVAMGWNHLSAVALALFLSLPLTVMADGVIIPPTAYAQVEVPEQQALICYAEGIERLAIETSFLGGGTNFAWVIPLPSKPEVEATTSGLFPTLRILFRPDVIHNVPHFWGGILALGAVVHLFRRVRPTGSLTLGDAAACLLLTLGLFVFSASMLLGLLSLFSLLAVADARKGGSLILSLGFVMLLALVLSSLVLSAGSSGTATAGGVQVLDRKVVGVYETATLTSPDGSALMDWLSRNGFAAPTNIVESIRAYAKAGWVFVAAKVKREQDTATATAPHPLVFTFKTDNPVYPLRLTGAVHGPCRVDLYVLGPGRAQIPKFRVERCEQTTYQPDDRGTAMPLCHPQIMKVAGQAAVGTKLTARLEKSDMLTDAWIAWQPFARKRNVSFSYGGACIMAANAAFALLGTGFLCLPLIRRRWATASAKSLVLISIAVALSVYVALPKLPVRLSHMPVSFVRIFHNSAVRMLEAEWRRNGRLAEAPTTDLLRERIRQFQFQIGSGQVRTNPFSGLPYREEDSPGNYVLREAQSGKPGFEYVWYTLEGEERVSRLFDER